MKTFAGMTCREWAKRHAKGTVNKKYVAGAFGCPSCFPSNLERTEKIKEICSEGHDEEACRKCWDTFARKDGKWIITEVRK